MSNVGVEGNIAVKGPSTSSMAFRGKEAFTNLENFVVRLVFTKRSVLRNIVKVLLVKYQ